MCNKLDLNKKFFLSCLADNIFHESDRQKNESKFYTCFTESESAEHQYKYNHRRDCIVQLTCSVDIKHFCSRLCLLHVYIPILPHFRPPTGSVTLSTWVIDQTWGHWWLWILTNFFSSRLSEPRWCQCSQTRKNARGQYQAIVTWNLLNKGFIMWLSGDFFLPGQGG